MKRQFVLRLRLGMALLVVLITTSLQAQTVTYQNFGGVDRPTAINGLVVNGVTYNVAITYNVPIDGTVLSGVPDAVTAGNAIQALLNTKSINSASTGILIVTGDNGGSMFVFRVEDLLGGLNDWTVHDNTGGGGVGDQLADPIRGLPIFTVVIDPIPTLSQWGLIIFGLLVLNLGLVFVYKKQLITTEVSLPAMYIPFNGSAFSKYFMIALSIIGVAFILAMTLFGYELMTFDVPGSVLTAGLVAYLVQLIKHK